MLIKHVASVEILGFIFEVKEDARITYFSLVIKEFHPSNGAVFESMCH